MKTIYCFLLFFLPLFGLAQNNALLDLFEEETLPYESPDAYYSQYDADVESVDFSEVIPFKEIDQTTYPDFADVVYGENASVYAVNKIKIGENYLLVCYVNSSNVISGEEINLYQAVMMNKDGALMDSSILCEESNAMGDDGDGYSAFFTYATSSEVVYDEYDEAYYIILVEIESRTDPDNSFGAIYGSSVTSFRKIESDGKITDVTTY